MNFLTKMSIAQKLFLIPIIGTVGFLLYLGITTITGLRNVELLDDIIEVQYPALDATNSALVKIEKVRVVQRLLVMKTHSIQPKLLPMILKLYLKKFSQLILIWPVKPIEL